MSEANEEQVAALRAAVRRWGRIARWLSVAVRWSLAAGCLWLGLVTIPHLADLRVKQSRDAYFRRSGYYPGCGTEDIKVEREAAAAGSGVAMLGVSGALVLGWLTAALYCAGRRRQLGRALAALAP